MTQKYDWDAIRVRFARGETCHAISKSMNGKPTRQGIMKRAKRENWLQGNSSIPESVKNLPLVQSDSKLPRKRTPEAVNAIVEFISKGATEEMAARATGIHPRTLYNWKLECSEFAAMIEVARAQKVVEWVDKIDRARDWKAHFKLLQVAPETKEQFSDRRKDEGPTIILNIRRDELVIEQPQNEPIEVIPEIESSPEAPTLESSEVVEPEAKRPKECWQGDDWRARQTVDVSEDMVVAGVSELIGFDPEDGHFHDAATRIYRAMEESRIDLLRNLEGLRELGQTDRR